MGKISNIDIEAFVTSLTDKQCIMILRAMFFGFTFGFWFAVIILILLR